MENTQHTQQQQLPAQAQAQAQNTQKQMRDLSAIMLCEDSIRRYSDILGIRAHNFILSMLDFVNADEKLRQCDNTELIVAMQKIAILGLLPTKEFGMVNLIPFWSSKDQRYHPSLVIGYKGLIDIALRGGGVKVLNWGRIYDGGHVRRYDWLTGDIEFNEGFFPTAESRIIGYFAYYERTDGYHATMVRTLEEMADHAVRYCFKNSRTLPTREQLMAKAGKPCDGLGWLADFDKMAEKTMVRTLLKTKAIMTDALAIAIESSGDDDLQPQTQEQLNEANNANTKTLAMPPSQQNAVKHASEALQANNAAQGVQIPVQPQTNAVQPQNTMPQQQQQQQQAYAPRNW